MEVKIDLYLFRFSRLDNPIPKISKKKFVAREEKLLGENKVVKDVYTDI